MALNFIRQYCQDRFFLLKVDALFFVAFVILAYCVFTTPEQAPFRVRESSHCESIDVEDIAKRGIPVWLRNCSYVSKIPGITHWSPDKISNTIPYLKDVLNLSSSSFYYIDATKQIQSRRVTESCAGEDSEDSNFCKRNKYKTIKTMKTEDFWKGCKNGRRYWHSSSLRNARDEYPRGILDSVKSLVVDGKLSSLNSWFGCKGVTTELHYDMSHNIFIQVWGRKKITLLRTLAIHTMPSFTSIHYVHPPVEAIQSSYERNEEINITVSPGEILYIPPLVYHRVEVLDTAAISINIWSKSSEDIASEKLEYDFPLPFEAEWMPDFATRVYVSITYIKFLLKHDLVDINSNGLKAWYNSRWNHSFASNDGLSNTQRQASSWAIGLLERNGTHFSNGGKAPIAILPRHFDIFEVRSTSIIETITHLVESTVKQRVILWNYVDEIFTFAVSYKSKGDERNPHSSDLSPSTEDLLKDILLAVLATSSTR